MMLPLKKISTPRHKSGIITKTLHVIFFYRGYIAAATPGHKPRCNTCRRPSAHKAALRISFSR